MLNLFIKKIMLQVDLSYHHLEDVSLLLIAYCLEGFEGLKGNVLDEIPLLFDAGKRNGLVMIDLDWRGNCVEEVQS